MATRLHNHACTMPDIATRRSANGQVQKDYFPCDAPLARIGQYFAHVRSDRLSLDMGPFFDMRYSALRARYNRSTAEWDVPVDSETWAPLMAFLRLYQVWWDGSVTAWLQVRCDELNAE